MSIVILKMISRRISDARVDYPGNVILGDGRLPCPGFRTASHEYPGNR